MKEINNANYESFFLDYIEGNLNAEERQMVEAFVSSNPHLKSELESFEMLELDQTDESAIPSWDSLKRNDTPEVSEEERRDQLFFASIEGTISSAGQKELDEILKDEVYRREFELWRNTLLRPEGLTANITNAYQDGLDIPLSEENYDYYLAAYSEGILNDTQIDDLKTFISGDTAKSGDMEAYRNLRLKAAQGVFYPNKAELKKSEKAAPIIWLYRVSAVAAAILFAFFLWNLPTDKDPRNGELAEIEESIPQLKTVDSLQLEPDGVSIPDSSVANEGEMQEAPLFEWEIREPDPLEIAEEAPQQKMKELKTSPEPNQDFQPIDIKVEPIDLEDNLAESDTMSSAPSDLMNSLDTEEDDLANISGSPSKPSKEEYQTISDLAEGALANKLELSDAERDEIALSLAKRLTKKASEVLDAEVKKEEMNEGESLTYTLRVGSFKVKHSKRK